MAQGGFLHGMRWHRGGWLGGGDTGAQPPRGGGGVVEGPAANYRLRGWGVFVCRCLCGVQTPHKYGHTNRRRVDATANYRFGWLRSCARCTKHGVSTRCFGHIVRTGSGWLDGWGQL